MVRSVWGHQANITRPDSPTGERPHMEPHDPFPATTWDGIGADGWDGCVGNDDLKLISASSVPKACASPALERWGITRTIEQLAIRLPEFENLLATGGLDAAVRWASELRYLPDEGAELNAADSGTLMHGLLEAWLKGENVPDTSNQQILSDPVLTSMATNLWNWYSRFQPEAVAMEQVIYSPEMGTAGRFDAIVQFRKAPELGVCLMDLKNTRSARYKSGGLKKVFGDSHGLQLATYRYSTHVATFKPRLVVKSKASSTRTYLLNTAERAACKPMWHIDSTVIVANNPEQCLLYPIDTGPAVLRRAVEAVGLHRWIAEESKNVVGPTVIPLIELPRLVAQTEGS